MQIKLHIPNLYLWVTTRGYCTFRFKVYINGKFTWVTLGKHPDMTVSDAVVMAHQMQTLRNDGINPNFEKREQAKKSVSLSDYLDDYLLMMNKINPVADSTAKYQGYLFGIIRDKLGNERVQDITPQLIYNKLIRGYVDGSKLAMANRFRIKLKQVFDYAVKQELIIKNPVDSLDTYYKPKNTQERNLHLSESELTTFINTLYNANISNAVKYYVHLIIILGVRKSELQNAKWDMIDFDNAVFNNYQIKTKKINKIPLSNQAITLLSKLKSISRGDSYIVVNNNTIGKNKPVGHSYFNHILDALDFNLGRDRAEKISPHDFRRVLSTLANESELFAPIDIEMALGHETRSGTEKHYNNSTTYLNRKRAVFDWIANKVDSLIDDGINIYNLLVVL